MRIPLSPRRATQLSLFQSVRNAPRWEQFPLEVRQLTVRLLARMLGEHGARKLASPRPSEVGDE